MGIYVGFYCCMNKLREVEGFLILGPAFFLKLEGRVQAGK